MLMLRRLVAVAGLLLAAGGGGGRGGLLFPHAGPRGVAALAGSADASHSVE